MKLFKTAVSWRAVLLSLGVLGTVAGYFALPSAPEAQAGRKATGEGLFTISRSQEPDLPNYDIRSDKGAFEKLAVYRNAANRSASDVADRRDDMVRAESSLKSKVPTLKIEYSPEIRTPEVIAPDVSMGRAFLAGPTKQKKSEALRSFLGENKALIGATDAQVGSLRLFADYKNPDGNLGFVEYNQEINGIPVFRGEIKAAYTRDGELIRVINNFAPGLDYASLSTEFGDPAQALAAAAQHINYELPAAEAARDASRSSDLKTQFGSGEWSPLAEKMYFPTEPGVAVPAWRVLIWLPARAYYVIVHAQTGEMLWRKNITDDQTQASTFEVYTNPNAMINVADSPAPLGPPVFNPLLATQGTSIPRTNVTRIGNEAPYNFNNNGWIGDSLNLTDGNNVESGLDLALPEGVDAGTHAAGIPFRVFSSNWNPPPGGADSPLSAEARRGAVIQQFYIMNWYHDELYRLGFTEQARNFQTNNYGRGGAGNDRISAEGQDVSGFNNANFGTGADGLRGKMQMYVFSAPSPMRDGTAEAEIMIHEVTHGTSNRLHANASGLTANMSKAMGEGWSDFYAHCLLSEPGDQLNGTYPMSGYLLLNGFGAIGSSNYYYGMRRFPKAIMSATGGPQNRPYNPLTFADIDQSKVNTADGAFPAMFGAHISTNADQVHAAGEVWSTALWEFRTRMVQRLGWAVGNRRALQLVTDAMKLSPINPTFLQGRDAIVAAAIGSATTTAQLEDASDVWTGFAIRGMGVNASIQQFGSGDGMVQTRVTESFDKPDLLQLPTFTISDAGGDNDGLPEPGEPIVVTVPLTNIFGTGATAVSATLAGGSAVSYGSIAHASTVTRQFNYTVPAGTPCGSLATLPLNINSSLGSKSFTLRIPIGVTSITLQQNFDGVSAPILPAGWTNAASGTGVAFATTNTAADTAPNSAFAPSTAGGTGSQGSGDLVSPTISVNSGFSTVSFRHRFNFETGYDGGVLDISINGGQFNDIIQAGGSFMEFGYTGTIDPAATSPITGRAAWTGTSNGNFVTSTVQLPAANGQNIRLRWRAGSDSTVTSVGWHVDSITVRATSSCSFSPSTVRSRADFDGDGRTDLSVFRPSEGNWYVWGTQAGFFAASWGISTDTLAPGDYDGDGKTDFAVFRPTPGDGPDFYIIRSNGFVFSGVPWGEPGDKPVIGDYDGDGKDDVTVYRSSDTTWYTMKSTGGLEGIQFGQAGDVAVPGKFDGDGKTDRAVYRNGIWVVSNSTGGTSTASWGIPGDVLVPADYDGDNRDDLAVWRPSDGNWYIQNSSNLHFYSVQWGEPGDIPAPGDYDGDGKDDPSIYRTGMWYLARSQAGLGAASWGVPGDVPVPSKYLP